MPNTYTQLYAQIIFSPKGRQNLINKNIEENVYRYISGIITNQNQKLMIINGMPDHVHIFLGFSPDIALSDLIRDIKTGSTKHINENKLLPGQFSWQTGFGAFTYSKSQVMKVVEYIMIQKEHHKKKTFREEYLELLEKFEVDYKPEYLFEWYE